MSRSSQPDITKKERRFYWFWILPFQTMLMTSYIMPMYGFNAFLKSINEIFDPANPLNGWPGAIAGGLVFLGTAFGGVLHRFLQGLSHSPRVQLVISNVMIALSLAFSAFACWNHSLWVLVTAGSFVMGIAMGCTFSLAAALLLGWGRYMGHLGLQSGVFGLMFGLWGAIYSLIAPMAIHRWGIEWTFIGTGSLILIFTGLCSIRYRMPTEQSAKENPRSTTLDVRQVFRTKQFWFFTICMLILLTPGFGFKVIVQSLAENIYHVSSLSASLVAVAFLTSYGISRLICGCIADHVKLKPMYLLFTGGQMMLLVVTAIGLPHVEGITFMAVMMCLIGSLFAAGKSLWGMLAISLLGTANIKNAIHGLMIAFGLAGLLGPITLNWALRSNDVLMSTSWWLYAMAACMAIACLLVWIMRAFDFKAADQHKRQPIHWWPGSRDELDRF